MADGPFPIWTNLAGKRKAAGPNNSRLLLCSFGRLSLSLFGHCQCQQVDVEELAAAEAEDEIGEGDEEGDNDDGGGDIDPDQD